MKRVAVYVSKRASNMVGKETLIFNCIDLALDAMPGVDWHRPEMLEGTSRPGLREVCPRERIVALGRAAHSVLADYHKRTLVADDEGRPEEDLERLVWSCINTSKVVALGRNAWRSVQMLPVMERHFYELPPLRMTPIDSYGFAGGVGADVLVINHEDEETRAAHVADILTQSGYRVQRSGGDGEGGADVTGWSATAPIHVHVGSHDLRVMEIRLVDTWHSRRFAILLLPPGRSKSTPADALMVDSEVNGFLCDSPGKVLAACADIRDDAVLRNKMLHAGTVSVAPLAREWLRIAADLID